eukprot:SAG11_NODE_20534_length_443_cov_1.069767_1_plen_25_part_10
MCGGAAGDESSIQPEQRIAALAHFY